MWHKQCIFADFYYNIFTFRNHPINCNQHSQLDIYQWKDNSAIGDDEMTVNKTEEDFERINKQNLVRDAWRKAEDDVSRRKQTEFLLWSKSIVIQ